MSEPGRLAAVDFGTRRIGVAITDPQRWIASPLCGYVRRDQPRDATWFRQLVADHQIVEFVVGLPLHMSGDESEKSQMARQFGAWLQVETGIPVSFHDERHSTQQADAWMAEAGISKKQQSSRRDMLAAHAILTSYLQANSEAPPRPATDDPV